MASYRYYFSPVGVITVDDLPPKWGLLVLADGKLKCLRSADHQAHDAAMEVSLLLSAIRRIGQMCPTGVSVKAYTFESKNRATLGVALEDSALLTGDCGL